MERHQLLESACCNGKYHHPQPGIAGDEPVGGGGQQWQWALPPCLTQWYAEPMHRAWHMEENNPSYSLQMVYVAQPDGP